MSSTSDTPAIDAANENANTSTTTTNASSFTSNIQ